MLDNMHATYHSSIKMAWPPVPVSLIITIAIVKTWTYVVHQTITVHKTFIGR